MIIYSITYNIDKEIEQPWLQYMKTSFVPTFLKTGYFKSNKILKLLNEEYSEGGITYSFQYSLENIADLEDFIETYESSIEKNLESIFAGKYVFFKTWLEEV